MTAPGFRYPDYNASQGIGSEVDKREWDIFLRRRKELADSIAGRVQMQQLGVDSQTVDQVANLTEQQPGGIADQRTSPPNAMELNELIGAARYYGIQGADKLPPDRLKQIVEQRRLMVQEQQTPTFKRGAAQNMVDSVLEGAAMLGLGTTRSLLRSTVKIPFIGDAIQRQEVSQAAQQWLGSLTEGVEASLPEGRQTGHRIAQGTGAMLGYVLPAALAYRVVGAAGAIPAFAATGARLSPLMRAGLSELGTAWLLEGGGDESLGEKAQNIALAAGFGTALRGVPYLAGRLRDRFMPRGAPVEGVAAAGGGFRGRPGMEGQVVGDTPSAGMPALGAGQRALPPGQAGLIEGPGIDTPFAPAGGPGEVINPDILFDPSDAGFQGNMLMSPERAELMDLRRMTRTDPLTGLGNRVSMQGAMTRADPDESLRWIVFDGSRFKSVNDRFGHEAGDQALQHFSRALNQVSQEFGIAPRNFRNGGDEFAAIVPAEIAERFQSRAMEVSTIDFGDFQTRLDGNIGSTWAEADVGLMEIKRARKAAGFDSRSADASSVAVAMTKEATVIESPIINQVIKEADIDESTVARAAVANYPGQISVVQGVGDIGKTVRGLVQAQREGKLMPHQFRVVQIESPGIGPNPSTPQVSSTGFLRPYHGDPPDMARNQYLQRMVGTGDRPGTTWDFTSSELPPVLETNVGGTGYNVYMHSPPSGRHGPKLYLARPSANKPKALEIAGVFDATGRGGMVEHLAVRDVFQGKGIAQTLLRHAEEQGYRVDPKLAGELVSDEGATALNRFFTARDAAQSVPPIRRTDLLISEGLPITNKRVEQYKKHGMFEGQLATSAMGHEVRIKNPDGEFATVQSVYGGEDYFVPRNMLMPGKATMGGEELITSRSAEVTWQRFKQFATNEMAREGKRAGLPGFDWNDVEVSTQLPRLMNQFLGGLRLQPGERMAMEAYFERSRVGEYTQLAKQQMAAARAVNQQLNVAVVRSSKFFGDLPIEDIAATKAFQYLSEPGGQGGTLVDMFSGERIDTRSESDAFNFLRNFNREVPDHTPLDAVPFEAAPIHPMGANAGIELEPTIRGGEEQVVASVERMTRQVEQLTDVPRTPVVTSPPPISPPPSQPPSPPQPPSLGAPPSPGGFFPPERPSPAQSVGAQFEQLRREKPAALHAALEKMDSVWLRYGAPFRSFTLQMQQAFQEIGASEAKLWKHYNDLSTGVTQGHNEARKWHSEWNEIMTQFGRKKRRDGTVLKIEEIGDYNAKIQAMRDAGYSPREMNAQRRIRDLFDRMHNEAGISNYVFSYVPRVRMRQAAGVRDPFADKNLPREIEFFAEFARTGNLQFRQMDMGVLGTQWIRGWHFKQHVEPAWNQMVSAWDDPRVPSEIRGIVQNWLHIVRTGFQPQHDIAVQGVRHALNVMGVPVTDAEVAGMWNTIFSNAYRGSLGGRPDAIFRDAISPLYTGTRIGMTPVVKAYTAFMKGGGKVKDEMWERALKGGWVEAGQVRSVNAESFTQPLVTDTGASLLNPAMTARREMFARVGDVVHDMLPPSWRNGIQGSKFDPLFYYTKLGEFNRLISGEAGWQQAAGALSKYESRIGALVRAQQKAPNPAIEAEMDRALAGLMKESKAVVYRPPIQEEFKRLVTSGDYEGAANLLANESANMQFRYGQRENSVGLQQSGTKGRMAMMFGSFSQQFASYTKESLGKHVPIDEKAKFLARYAMVNGALGIAGAYTGWNFGKWMWHQSLAFAGGPMVGAIYNTAQAASGAVATMMGQSPNADQAAALRRMNPGDMAAGVAGFLNPFRSTFKTADSYDQALRSVNPVESTVRQTVTGDPSLRSDFQQLFQAQSPVDPDVLNRAIMGDQAARQLFRPDELSFVDSLKNAPPEVRWRAYAARARARGPNVVGAGAFQ